MKSAPHWFRSFSVPLCLALALGALSPWMVRAWEGHRLARAVAESSHLGTASGVGEEGTTQAWSVYLPAAENASSSGSAQGDLLASWQAIGGCGAGAGASTGACVKWIGRNVTGGLVNVQQQFCYTKLGTSTFPEYNYFSNTLVTADLTEKWSLGVNVPLIYRYIVDPNHFGGADAVDYSNAGIGDVSVMATRRLGDINDTLVTGIVGLPTGTWEASFTPGGPPINQNQQLGFGKPTATLVVDHVLDQVWGLMVVGASGSWRGGQNKIHNYRAPSASAYGYAGYFWGSWVPAVGLTASGFTGHDRDQDAEMYSPLAILSANLSLEWSTDWIAVIAVAQLPYRYDGFTVDDNKAPRSPWGFMPWTVGLGIAVAPF